MRLTDNVCQEQGLENNIYHVQLKRSKKLLDKTQEHIKIDKIINRTIIILGEQ